jgi:uncharacterized membrane protein YbaN (DUF454 family)
MKSHKLTIPEIIQTGKKVWWILFGTIWILIGIIGLVTPFMPDIPFFILGISFYAKAIGRFDDWLERKDLKKYLDLIYLKCLLAEKCKYLFGRLKKASLL